VDYERGLAGWVSAHFPIDLVAVAHIQKSMVVWFDLWIHAVLSVVDDRHFRHTCAVSPGV
jgi:hypothetical protein